MESTSIAHAAHAHAEHPPEVSRSSRVDPQLLGMLLFIISEAMLFGSRAHPISLDTGLG